MPFPGFCDFVVVVGCVTVSFTSLLIVIGGYSWTIYKKTVRNRWSATNGTNLVNKSKFTKVSSPILELSGLARR